jgi:uncharacterized membrane protein
MTVSYWGARALYGQVYSCVSFATEADRADWMAATFVHDTRIVLAADDPRVLAFLADHAAFVADEVAS